MRTCAELTQLRYPDCVPSFCCNKNLCAENIALLYDSFRYSWDDLRFTHALERCLVSLNCIDLLIESNRPGGAQVILPVEIERSRNEIEERPREVLHDTVLQSILLSDLLPGGRVLLHKLFDGVRLWSGSCTFQFEICTDTRPLIGPSDHVAVGNIESSAISTLVMIDRCIYVHAAKNVLKGIAVFILPASWSARKRYFSPFTVNLPGKGKPKTKTLSAVHEV